MRNTPKKPRIVSIKLNGELDHELTEIARRKNVTRSDVVREAIREYTVVRRTRSALDVAGDLVGSINGPGDLSTNKKYMKDYGR